MKKLLFGLLVAIFMLGAQAWAAVTVNINTASSQQLQQVQGIGPKTAALIVAYRDEHGTFKSVDDLLQVKGIGEKTLEKIRDELTTGK